MSSGVIFLLLLVGLALLAVKVWVVCSSVNFVAGKIDASYAKSHPLVRSCKASSGASVSRFQRVRTADSRGPPIQHSLRRRRDGPGFLKPRIVRTVFHLDLCVRCVRKQLADFRGDEALGVAVILPPHPRRGV